MVSFLNNLACIWFDIVDVLDRHAGAITTVATIVIAAFTIALAISTKRLWKEAIRSGIIAEKAANAAERSAVVADKSLSTAQRAFVFCIEFDQRINVINGSIKEYWIWMNLENVGFTPATHVQTWCTWKQTDFSETIIPTFTISPTIEFAAMGPKGKGQTSNCIIPIETLIKIWKSEIKVFIWARVEYRDIFNPSVLHHHEICVQIALIHEPSTPPPEGHIP